MSKYAEIIVDLHHQKVDRIFTYRLDGDLADDLTVGCMVSVPFGKGNKTQDGYVIGLMDSCAYEDSKVKSVIGKLGDRPLFTPDDLLVAKQMQERYMAPLSSCLTLFVPKLPGYKEPPKETVVFDHMPEEKLGNTQKRFLEELQRLGKRQELKLLRRQAPITAASLRSLVEKKAVHIEWESEGNPPASFVSGAFAPSTAPQLSMEQQRAADAIESQIEKNKYHGFLLHGITGSGKTEVYMHAIQRAIELGKQTILLVPEISLTPQLIELFTARFGDRVGVTHSRMSDRERSRMWHRADQGEFSVMIGPRSALFTPMRSLGLVILDEEHEASYRSEQLSPHYHAREVAMLLCKQKKATLLLGSATPSVETYYSARPLEEDIAQSLAKPLLTASHPDLTLLTLTKRAVKGSTLPSVELVDMRRELEMGNMSIFCDRLVHKIRERIEHKEQTILFLNRKGYATFVSCRKCGFVLKCPRCFLPYTYHKDKGRLICHHCGKEVALPAVCPVCGSKHLMQGGVGTQRVEETARALFPDARIVRMDMSTMKNREDYETVYRQFRNNEGDILIGTQMVAKGFDFPGVTLVGVLAADASLYDSDFHCTERTFQLLTQVAGRAGRADKQGEVLVQTYSPDHYCIQCAKDQDYLRFYNEEIHARKIMDCPPFTHLAQILISGRNEETVIRGAARLGQIMNYYAQNKPFEVLGPSPASLERINNVFRWKLLVKCKEQERLRAFVSYCDAKFLEQENSLLVAADIDPQYLE